MEQDVAKTRLMTQYGTTGAERYTGVYNALFRIIKEVIPQKTADSCRFKLEASRRAIGRYSRAWGPGWPGLALAEQFLLGHLRNCGDSFRQLSLLNKAKIGRNEKLILYFETNL